ncbi:MAG: hypothetical protein F3740_10520 [Nitrospinae bacterium]|nr:hypothetical protein [Nitrospinota bacterium]
MIIEPENKDRVTKDQEVFINELLEIAASYPHTCSIKKIFFYPDFPVDVRHNAKICREELADWVKNQP